MNATDKKTICLNMIVKNEAHIIADTLKHLDTYITFDYWVISDTGSTDATKEIITEFFKAKNIPGELIETPWKDFGYNRSVALEAAYKKTDYVFVWDADDEIYGDFVMPKNLKGDSYKFIFGNANGFRYSRCQLFNNYKKWCYKGVLHEYATCLEPENPSDNILGNYYFISGRKGDRSKDPNKYLKDALVLEKAFAEAFEKKDNIYNRYSFYCAQSYASCTMREKAIEWYKKALTLDLWVQERYICCLEIFDQYDALKRPEEGLRYLVESFKYDTTRVECFYRLIKHYCIQKSPDIAYMYYTAIKDFYENTYIQVEGSISNKLFVKKEEYDFYLPYYMIIVSEQSNHLDTCITMYEIICNRQYLNVGEWWIRNLVHNIQFCIKQLPMNLSFIDGLLVYLNKLYIKGIKLEAAHYTIIGNIINTYRPLYSIESPLASVLKSKTIAEPINVMLTITSCKRFDLFTKTVNSILNMWVDIDKVDYFFCVDDNSTQRDRSKMTKAYPFFNFYMKTSKEKGHRKSMNIIYDKLQELKPRYWIHMEDDWLFFQKDSYVEKSINFLEKYKSRNIYQILYNRNYAETYEGWTINGSEALEPGFLVHLKSDKIPGQSSGYWPHYSFRPSMTRVETILDLGNYDSPNTFFEQDYATRYFAKGYKSGFFNTICSLHIGKLTSDKTGTNAYTLNNAGQFGETAKVNTFIVNLVRRTDRKEAMEVLFDKEGITKYEFFEAVDGKTLEVTDEINQLFLENDFGSRKGFIGCALSHYYLWKQLLADTTNNYYVIFEDDITVSDKFKDTLDSIQSDMNSIDVLFFGYHVREVNNQIKYKVIPDTPIVPLDLSVYIGGTFGYSINKAGAKKLLDYISKNGIKHGIDYLMKIVPTVNYYCVQPNIVFSEWVSTFTSQVDTDIQKDYSSLVIIPTINKDDWEFFQGVDSTDGDIKCVGKLTVDTIFKAATEQIGCIAFNTLGFLKSKVISPFKSSPYINGSESGLYVKKTYISTPESMSTRLPKKNTYEIKDLIGLSKKCDWFIYHGGFINITHTSLPKYIYLSTFLNFNSLELFVNTCLPLLTSTYNLIIAGDDFTFPSGNGDLRGNLCADKQHLIQRIVTHPFLNRIYVENLDTIHPKMTPIPLGLVTNGDTNYSSNLDLTYTPIDFDSRSIKCLCVHRIRTGPQWSLREKVTDLCKTEWSSFVTYIEPDVLNPIELSKKMQLSRFCICVSGGGYDPSPKCWEALINGCIPIIKRSTLDEAYSKLPVIFVDDWTPESISEGKLNSWLQELRSFYEDQEKRKGVLNILSLDYWWKLIQLKPAELTLVRVKMLCNWCSSEELCKEWLKLSKGNYMWNSIQITWENTDIDYYVIINKPRPDDIFVPEKTIIFHMEPWCGEAWQTWGVKSWGEWARPDTSKFLQVRSHDKYFNTGFWQINLTHTELKEQAIIKDDSLGTCVSSICSSKYVDPGHKKRIDFMKFIESKDDSTFKLHVFGENNQREFKSYVGKAPSDKKEIGILPYKYYFICENNAEHNYITEKLWEPIVCESLCFYWGCPNVTDYIDPLAFVQLDMDDFEGSFKIIKEAIESNLWEQRLPAIKAAKEKILDYYGFFPTLERVILNGSNTV